MYQPAEFEVIDLLSACDKRYRYFERFAFDNDRERALRSIDLMRTDGAIELWIDGQRVEAWRVAMWRRAPYERGTRLALHRLRLSLHELPETA